MAREDQRESGDEARQRLQRRLELVFGYMKNGIMQFSAENTPETFAALKRVRRRSDGSFDLSSVEPPVRALCAAVDEIESASPSVEEEFFDGIPEIALPDARRPRQQDGDFMADAIEAGNTVLGFIAASAAVPPLTVSNRTEQAILTGHMVRLFKIYDSVMLLLSEGRGEIVMILFRSLIDTAIHLLFLVEHGKDEVFKAYQKAALAYDKRMWETIEGVRQDPPLPIEARMQASVERHFEESGYPMDEVDWSDRYWCGSTKDKADRIENGKLHYELGFRAASHSVHGTWTDIRLFNLQEKDGVYLPRLEYSPPQPQMLEGASVVCLDASATFVRHMAGETGRRLLEKLAELRGWFEMLSHEHESFMQRQTPGNEPG